MIKSYTDLEQSKKLAEILPPESADMYYDGYGRLPQGYAYTLIHPNSFEYDKPCWSLAALLDFLPNSAFLERGSVTKLYRITLPIELIPFDWFVEPVDACVAMIVRLHELKML